MPGEIWEESEIKEVVDQIHAAGFSATVVESVNVHDDIKIGLPTRDKCIETYKPCIRNRPSRRQDHLLQLHAHL